MSKVIKKGYKVTLPDMTCNPNGKPFQFELGKEYSVYGSIELCGNGFHFCEKLVDCFSYYDFEPKNRVFEVEAWGNMDNDEKKTCAQHIKLINEITWEQVLTMVNTGSGNSGCRNSGDRNSGNCNSGYWNSGNSNSGDSNSGYRNSGNWNSGNSNSGDSNSGYRNSGNWNSGDRNSGDSNSGYRNSGAFCTDTDPVLFLFDKPTKIKVREWENSEVVSIMNRIDPTIWVPGNMMTDEEKKAHPKWETAEGYLKTISMHEAWANMWGNLNERTKKLFYDLPNFDAAKFEQITGIKA